ncbi:hypothetical protein GCM10009750_30790 [Agromyces salentinus]|uniref:YtxH domain-containing protein n=1 Tax=Agromyces salentinus TaxID=269421 RepID=A0ABP4Z8Q9_9MICO
MPPLGAPLDWSEPSGSAPGAPRDEIGQREHFVKSILWFATGIVAGFVVAHQVNQTAQGREFFTSVDAKAKAFGRAVADGYHEREAELRSAADELLD